MRILLVDDDLQLLETMSELLTQRGYDVHTSSDCLEAIDYLQKEGTDILVTDIVMPRYDGLELIITVREQFPKLRIIAISGGGKIDKKTYLMMAKGLRADAVLEKPFLCSDLDALIKSLF
ncbi:MAG: response regulator [Candidatus Cloacimonetes bacterium]|nr:response regulator [Candidatus Cloacimonadota bacterium]